MNGSGVQPLQGMHSEASSSDGDEDGIRVRALQFRKDTQSAAVASQRVFDQAILDGTRNVLNHQGLLLPSTNDPLLNGGLGSSSFASHERSASSRLGGFDVQPTEITRSAAGLSAMADPFMYPLDTRMQLLQGQLDHQNGLSSFLMQQPMLGSLDLRQTGPLHGHFLTVQEQLQMDQLLLQEQQQQQYKARNLGLMGSSTYLPGGSLTSPNFSLAMLGGQMNPSLLIQDPMFPNPAALAALHPGVIHPHLSYATAPLQLDMLVQNSRTGQLSGGGARESTFPMKLHRILADPRFQDCICWLPDGKSWRILNNHVFANVVLPEFFKHQKYASFMRQVNGKNDSHG